MRRDWSRSEPFQVEEIGVAGIDLLPMHVAEKALAAVGAGAKRVDEIVRWVGRCKTPDEIESARKATAVAEKGYDELRREQESSGALARQPAAGSSDVRPAAYQQIPPATPRYSSGPSFSLS